MCSYIKVMLIKVHLLCYTVMLSCVSSQSFLNDCLPRCLLLLVLRENYRYLLLSIFQMQVDFTPAILLCSTKTK